MEKKFKRTTVTSALPYANGPVHIGHLAGVYVPADIYVRYLRLKKEDVLFIGGSDEHGVPITIRAKKEGITPQDVVDRYHSLIKESFKEFGISFDVYSRTTSPTHHQLASDFFKTLYNKGEFIEKTSEQYYDEEAKTFLADRYITGECPHCHSEGAYGDQCEKCGTSLSPTDLINPKSAISGSKPVMKETKHWYLPLDKHEAWLRKWILEDHKEWRPNVYGQCKSWLDMGLQPRAVSRDLDWGIPVPVEGAEGKVLYVWFDAPIGYISNTKELLPDSWETWWKDPETRLIHFIGKDNIVFHCIVFPAMLKAEGSYILPDNVPSNEFLNLEGDKISTSRNWAVWLHEYLADFPGKQDVLRYVLTANAPETKDNDFTWKDFQARNNNELVAVYGNFVNRALQLTKKYFDGVVPAAGELNDYDRETLKEFPIRTSVAMQMEDAMIDGILSRCGAVAICSGKATSAPYTQKEYLADIERFVWAPTRAGRTLTETEMRLQMNYLTKLIEGSVAGVAKNATRKGIADMYAHIEVPEWLKAASRERFGIISEEFMGCFNNKPREMQAARLEEISGFDDDVDLKAPIEPMEHIYYGELKKVRSLVAASASTGSADTQRHYRLLLYKIDQALK